MSELPQVVKDVCRNAGIRFEEVVKYRVRAATLDTTCGRAGGCPYEVRVLDLQGRIWTAGVMELGGVSPAEGDGPALVKARKRNPR